MFAIQIFKALDRKTAFAELYQGEMLVAEVLANDGEMRGIYVSEGLQTCGLDWADLLAAASGVNKMLNAADAEMQEVRKTLGER